jgi:hypothetical protein
VTVALNFTSRSLPVPVGEGRVAVSTGMDREGEAVTGELLLDADEGVVVVHR